MRVILYTGKGGVGKTTISTATAYACAHRGLRTIVLSTDSAHSLSDLLEREIGPTPVRIDENLSACEIEVYHELAKNWETVQHYLKRFLASRGYDDVIADELTVMPGMEDLFSLLHLLELEEKGEYDAAIIDCAPTGATLQLLGFTDVFEWYMNRLFHVERKVVRTIRPLAERLIKAPLPGDEVFGQIEELYRRIMAIKELLTDPTRSSVRLVLNPEKMVIAESRRAYTCLALYGYPVDAVIANRLLPDAVDGYLREWLEIQQKHLATVRTSFDPLPLLQCKLYPREMTGLAAVAALSRELFGELAPEAVLHRCAPFELTAKDDHVEMHLHLPGVTKKEVELLVKDGELIVTASRYKRHILLPRQLENHRVTKAKYEDETFTIFFTRETA